MYCSGYYYTREAEQIKKIRKVYPAKPGPDWQAGWFE